MDGGYNCFALTQATQTQSAALGWNGGILFERMEPTLQQSDTWNQEQWYRHSGPSCLRGIEDINNTNQMLDSCLNQDDDTMEKYLERIANSVDFNVEIAKNNTDPLKPSPSNTLISNSIVKEEIISNSDTESNSTIELLHPEDPNADTIPLENKVKQTKNYTCPYCGKMFINNSYLSQHKKLHLGVKQYQCQICLLKFAQLVHLQQHLRTHVDEKPYKYTEPDYKNTFSHLSNKQMHPRSYQRHKPYKCKSCYKCFGDKPSYLDHIPTHSERHNGEINVCPYCPKTYSRICNMQKHIEIKHTEVKKDGKDVSANIKRTVIDNDNSQDSYPYSENIYRQLQEQNKYRLNNHSVNHSFPTDYSNPQESTNSSTYPVDSNITNFDYNNHKNAISTHDSLTTNLQNMHNYSNEYYEQNQNAYYNQHDTTNANNLYSFASYMNSTLNYQYSSYHMWNHHANYPNQSINPQTNQAFSNQIMNSNNAIRDYTNYVNNNYPYADVKDEIF